MISLSDNTEIIIISETAEENEPVRMNAKASSVDDGEVNSPQPGSASRVRRKLFHMDAVNLDHFSSSKSPSRVIPTKKVLGSSPAGLSCASWSPLPTSCKTAP